MNKHTSEHDPVSSPAHYTAGGIETIDYLQAKMSPEEFAGFCRGNVLKYASRHGHKAPGAEDLRKAMQYLEWLIATVEGRSIRDGRLES